MEYIKIKDLDVQISDGNYSSKYPNSSEFISSGIPFIRCNNFFNNSITDKDMYYISKEKHSELLKGHLKTNDVLISTRGNIGQVVIVPEKYNDANINAQIVLLRPGKALDCRYLMWSLKSGYVQKQMEQNQTGSALKQLPVKRLSEIKVPIEMDINIQKNIADKLDKVFTMINLKKEEMKKIDELIKSQFVEMFGNPLLNIDNSISMTEVCEIIDGDRGNNYPKQSDFYADEYCLFLNAKNVTDHGFDFSNNVYITKEKDEQLRKGKLKRGDVILTTRGTVGNLAFYDKDVIYENIRINSGMVILRMDKEKINERFFIEQFRFQLDNIKFKIANGSAQPQLPISKMNAIKLLLPDIEFQNKFAQIAEQIDKQKFEFENSLKKLEELQASLMQEYFG